MSSGKERNDQKFCRSQQQVLESGRTNDLRFNGQELVLLLFHLSLVSRRGNRWGKWQSRAINDEGY